MARGYSFNRLITEIARAQAQADRAHAKAIRESERQERARQREYEREQRELKKLLAQGEKEAKKRYLESRLEETVDKNKELEEQIDELRSLLEHTLKINDMISFDSLKINDEFPEFSIPEELKKIQKAPEIESDLVLIKKPGVLGRLIPGVEKRYQMALQQAHTNFQLRQKKHEIYLAERDAQIMKLREEYEVNKKSFNMKVMQRNQEVDEFEKAYQDGDPVAIVSYNTMVLERSEYPENFPQEFRMAYLSEPKELVIEYELPPVEVISEVLEYRYIKSKDVIEEKLRKSSDIKDLYQDIVASVCLRTIHEIFEANQGDKVLIVVFNGFVQAVDPSTGKDIRPHLISIRTTKERFSELNLIRVDKRACLRNLGAQVSSKPDELVPVKPIVEFDMVDKRFVEQSDIIADLESRPNLMELNPFEFENLVSNLFGQIGFQAKLTRSAKDGGVDAIAFDPRPILGGKVVIQAKRYKNVVGVSAVRDLYGTMINEGANKGILVATSHYGPDAYDFAKDKPIELIDGGGLLYLLEQQGVRARIIFPDD